MLKINRKFEAFLDQMNEITILVPKQLEKDNKSFYIEKEERKQPLVIKQKINLGTQMKYVCQFSNEKSFEFRETHFILDESGNKTDLQIGSVIRSNEFDVMFAYDGEDLGAIYSKDKTNFKVWAPTATSVKVRLYRKDKTEFRTIEMNKEAKGTWTAVLEGDFEGYYYTYLACINLVWREAVDPYATAVAINGEFGVIIDKEKTNTPTVPLAPLKQKTDTIIYEAHIRDFSMHEESGMIHKGKYKAWLERGTRNKQGDSTGLSYLVELGITHVELLPVNDFEEVDENDPTSTYNWGYNPLHFFAPEGSYSMNPSNPYERIIELKSLIQALHKEGIRVILDVVYNHVYCKENSSFEKLLPGYYFRYDANGLPSNGTGVGNDLASERYMVKKFIVDCAVYWMKEYDIDGFRFDLMGIIDVETMKEVQNRVLSLKPDAILLGEGWDLNTPLPSEKKAIIKNAEKTPEIAYFNDQFRDSVKGSTFSLQDRGFVYGNTAKSEQIKLLISGSPDLFSQPHQTINYVESHDNHTMWDRLLYSSPDECTHDRQARHRLATSIVLMSQGIPFLHAGQEFFRSKKGVENSYNSADDINALNWKERTEHKENVDYIKGLIQIRKHHGAFRLPSANLIKKHLVFNIVNPLLISYQLQEVDCYGPWRTIYIIHNNHLHQHFTITLPNGDWRIIADDKQVFLNDPKKIANLFTINKLGTYIFCKK